MKKLPPLLLAALLLAAAGVLVCLLPLHLGVTGLCLMGLGAVCALLQLLRGKQHEKGLRAALLLLTALGLTVLTVCVAYIDAQGRDSDLSGGAPEFVVVLGAQIQGERPSRTLRERLDLAARYLQQQPDARVIVSGGQGADERCTEASVMERYLLEKGVAPERILREEQASTTRENLIYSAELARAHGVDVSRVLIITSEYHLCRAKYIAGSLGMTPYGLGSRTGTWILKVNYELREVFAFVKAFWQARRI